MRAAARHAREPALGLPVFGRNMGAARTGPAGVFWCDREHLAAPPCLFVFKLPPELVPPLIENGFVEAGLRFDVFARLPGAARRALAHVADLQIFNDDDRVVFADRRGSLVQIIAPDIHDFAVQFLNLGFLLSPVV